MTIKAKSPGGYGTRQEGQFTVWSVPRPTP